MSQLKNPVLVLCLTLEIGGVLWRLGCASCGQSLVMEPMGAFDSVLRAS